VFAQLLVQQFRLSDAFEQQTVGQLRMQRLYNI
jgi:hypothetical protein